MWYYGICWCVYTTDCAVRERIFAHDFMNACIYVVVRMHTYINKYIQTWIFFLATQAFHNLIKAPYAYLLQAWTSPAHFASLFLTFTPNKCSQNAYKPQYMVYTRLLAAICAYLRRIHANLRTRYRYAWNTQDLTTLLDMRRSIAVAFRLRMCTRLYLTSFLNAGLHMHCRESLLNVMFTCMYRALALRHACSTWSVVCMYVYVYVSVSV
jgi:hypothetical protein